LLKELKEYYEYYLTLHQNKWNRRLHALGQVCTIVFVMWCLNNSLLFLLLAPFVVYPFAWTGHIVFEKNKPAAWSKPLFAKLCDWIMLKDMIIGRLER
tara:strand:+ start:1241 stop:1534 length:294 start_codon:yes stop_codon:yes gene_type:complete